MSTILVVGEDEALLATRAAVLRTTGARTFCVGSGGALAVQAERECDVVVLCHSLAVETAAALAEAIQEGWPKTRTKELLRRSGRPDGGVGGQLRTQVQT